MDKPVILPVRRCDRPVASRMVSTAYCFWSVVRTFGPVLPQSLLIQHGFSKKFLRRALYSSRGLEPFHLGYFHTANLLTPGLVGRIGDSVLTAKLPGRNPSPRFAGNTDDLLVEKRFLMVMPSCSL